MISNAAQAAALLRASERLVDESLSLNAGELALRIRSNCAPLIQDLAEYFAHVTVAACEPDLTIEAYDTALKQLDVEWRDWAREPGKTGRKDAYYPLEDGRLVQKVRTGMVFLQSFSVLIAAGPCRERSNQVINFINSQYMNWLQQRGWLICHASACDIAGRGVAVAGLSGGGKSTLLLGLMEYPDVGYVTNDRLFIRRERNRIRAAGIPKMPRVNPGTIVYNPALSGLLNDKRRQELLSWPSQKLWDLEEKHDVMVNAVYGPGRIRAQTRLQVFVVLNWAHETADPTTLVEVDLEARRDLLAAIMKSPGPFLQFSDGSMYPDSALLDARPYIETLHGLTVLEARGRVDIPWLTKELYQWIQHNAG